MIYMGLNKKILILTIILFFIFITGAYSANTYQNINNIQSIVNNTDDTDLMGCCSIVLQLEDNNTLMSYRRDSNLTADIHIDKINWHGIPAIKQYKTDGDYFCHVIITSDGWVIGLGGIDDGADNEKCEKIAAKMISDDYKISKSDLVKIQKIKKPYGRGHMIIKAPNGNYGFATVDKVKTGHIEPGQYISLPNNYSYSRAGNISINSGNNIENIIELAQSDKYGVDRREVITYDFQTGDLVNKTDIYVSNEDGSELGIDYTDCIDDVYVNTSVINANDIPIAPHYKNIGSYSFINEDSTKYKAIILITIIAFVIFIGILYFVVSYIIRLL